MFWPLRLLGTLLSLFGIFGAAGRDEEDTQADEFNQHQQTHNMLYSYGDEEAYDDEEAPPGGKRKKCAKYQAYCTDFTLMCSNDIAFPGTRMRRRFNCAQSRGRGTGSTPKNRMAPMTGSSWCDIDVESVCFCLR